jgi:competence protein ComEC
MGAGPPARTTRSGPPRRRVGTSEDARPTGVPWWVLLAFLVALLAVVGWMGGRIPLDGAAGSETATPPPPDGLEVHFIDVDQGDATLLRTPDATVLVDTGRHDRDDVVPYLQAVGVDALDVVAITHPHADHLGQFDRVLDAVAVQEVWWSGSTHTTATFDRALDALERSDAAYAEPRAGDVTEVGDLTVAFLNPVDPLPDDLHDAGLVLRVTWRDVRVLLTGDAEAITEDRMVQEHPELLDADIYQVGHHGSVTSTSSAFLAAVSPAVAVYSAGAGNPYGHPHQEVIARLQAAGVAVYGTDVHGTLVISSDGTGWTVRTSAP